MEIFLENITNFFKFNFKEEEAKINELNNILKNVIINENNNIKFDSFKKFILKGKEKEPQMIKSDDDKQIYYTYVLFLFLLDIHKDFKNDLLVYLKDKNLKPTLEKIFRSFFKIVGLITTDRTDDISLLRIKLKMFNHYFEISRMILSDELVNNDEDFIKMFMDAFCSITKSELRSNVENTNEEVCQLLIMYFKYFHSFFKELKKDIIENNLTILKSLLEVTKGLLIEHIKIIEHVQFSKDFEFNFSNSIFLLINFLTEDSSNYMRNSIELLTNFENDAAYLLIYIKSFIINFPNQTHLIVLNAEFPFLNNFVQKYVIPLNSVNYSSLTLMNFYKLFLENDLRKNFTVMINDVVQISIHRLFTSDSNHLQTFSSYITENRIIDKIFIKMRRDKNNFNIMDDNYFYIIESLHRLSEDCKTEVNCLSNLYLNDLILKKERLMMIEARMFKFIDLDKEKSGNTDTMKAFFVYIFSKPYEKKNLSLINEYIKILFEILFTSSINSKDKQVQLATYKRFTEIFPDPFFEFLFKLQSKDLKYLNNILANLEKYNKNLYSIIVYEFYRKYFIENPDKVDYVYKMSIFLTLFKPFKNHKRTLTIKDKTFHFAHIILENDLEIKFAIDIKELKNLAKLSERFVVLYLIEFIIGLDEPEKVFPIVKSLLKYNVKSSYVEYKSSVMKALTMFFNDYADKLVKCLSKSKPSQTEFDFINNSLQNFDFLFKFLSENIYDRPVENILVYLEILKINVDAFDNSFYPIREKIKNEKMKNLNEELISLFEKIIYNKELALSLISLLRQSWYFVRVTAFYILKNKKYHAVLADLKGFLTKQLGEFFYSLRQMDAEGSANLFLLLLHHYKEDFLCNYSPQVLEISDDLLKSIESKQVSMKCVEICQTLIIKRAEDYFSFVSKKETEKSVCDYSVHSFYVLIRNILEEEKESADINSELLLKVGMYIIEINFKFSQFLVNNGVAEFSTDFDDVNTTDGEDKGLISLWCSAKYSIESFNVLLDIINNNYKFLSKNSNFENVLKTFQVYLLRIIDLMMEYKHMGAVLTFNESLLKVAKLLNRSEDNFKSYREFTYDYLREFLGTKLIKEEVCSILRRSAGIPFILTTLIKSYISHDKLSTFSHNRVIDILRYSIETLLTHYKTYQNIRPDVSVHCLHILRVISDDTQLKPFAKEFYDFIISGIVDGLGNKNWSIKNACMLLFSRIIKNNFGLNETKDKNIPTFVEYFTGKEELKKKILSLLLTEVKHENYECDDYLILLITFFSKFKKSKLAEINEKDLTDFIDVLFNLSHKNNKLFRKLLCKSIFKLYGDNIKLSLSKILSSLSYDKNTSNNKLDFVFNMISQFKDTTPALGMGSVCSEVKDFLSEVEAKIIKWFDSLLQEENYFVLNKIIKFYSKTMLPQSLKTELLAKNLIPIGEGNKIDISIIFNNLKAKSRRPFYYKFIKNTINYFLESGKYVFNNFDFAKINSSNEELMNIILKKFPHSILKQLSGRDLINSITEDKILFKLNVNISTKLIDFIINSKEMNDMLISDQLVCSKVLSHLIDLISKYKYVTKLVKRLLTIIPKIFIMIKKNELLEFLPSFIEIIEQFCTSDNEEKLRFIALQAFESILQLNDSFKIVNEKGLFLLEPIMRIFILTINDEHPEIRNYVCQIFSSFNNSEKLVKIKNEGKDIVYSNEYLNEKILNVVKDFKDSNEISLKSFTNFYSYLIRENLYFLKDKAKLNNENKVFYYEPENRYIDNVEIKVKLMRMLNSKTKNALLTSLRKQFNEKKDINPPVNVLMMLETFVEYITDNFTSLTSVLNEDEELPFSCLRKYLYKY